MNVYEKLNEARSKIHTMGLKKSGQNKFAGYQFFELQDFLVPALQVFKEVGLTGFVSFGKEEALLTIVDIESPSEKIVITSPMSEANLKGCHPIQNLGAVQTYLRRYLWVAALEIVEHDVLDATLGASDPEPKPSPKPAPKPATKAAPKPAPDVSDTPWGVTVPEGDTWKESVVLGATKALDLAQSKADVVEIFKVNRAMFERLSTEDRATYDNLMAIFSEYKKKFE